MSLCTRWERLKTWFLRFSVCFEIKSVPFCSAVPFQNTEICTGVNRKYVPILVYKQDELSERSVRRATWRCRFHCNCSSRFFFPDRHNTYTFTALSPRSAGWWFDARGFSNLNGIYYAVGHNIRKLNGIKWHHFRGPSYSLRSTAMMIRPYNFWAGLPQRRQAGGRPPRWPSTPRNIFTGFSYKRDEPEANICKSAS